MPQFLAITSKGLEDSLGQELEELGFSKRTKVPMGFLFETNWKGCYKANLCLRTATRVVLPILDFPAYQADDIYHNIKKHDFTKYIDVDQTLAVDSTVRDSKIRDQRIVALKTKDAIVDQFRDKYDRRPDVAKNPDLSVLVRVLKNQVSVSVDTSGEALFKRGYRTELVPAPLKEHVAAGLLKMTEWDGKKPIVDLMCGSGTFLIEAAMMAHSIAPGLGRGKFAFQNFETFNEEDWQSVVNETIEEEKDEIETPFCAFDVDRKAIRAARTNRDKAGFEDVIKIEKSDVSVVKTPEEIKVLTEGQKQQKGIVVVNPPYGERLGITEELRDVYRDLGFILKKEFKGWDCWILSGNPELTRHLQMKAEKKFFVTNGPIECRWLKYSVR